MQGNYRDLAYVSGMSQTCIIFLKSSAERGFAQVQPKTAAFQMKIGVSDSSLSNIFL